LVNYKIALVWSAKCVQGASNSGQFARVDMLAHEMEYRLPHFEVVRITKRPEEWQVSSTYMHMYIHAHPWNCESADLCKWQWMFFSVNEV